MSTYKPRKINGLFVLVATVGILFGSAGPAAASHFTGGGGSTVGGVGYELGPNLARLCSDTNNVFTGAYFTSTYYLVTHQAADYVVKSAGVTVARYNGPISMNAQHGGAILGPQGAMSGSLTTCRNGQVFVPSPVPLTKSTFMGRTTLAGNDGYVNCLRTSNGAYERLNTTVAITVEQHCTVKGNVTNQTAEVTAKMKHTWTGVQVICQDLVEGCAHPGAGSQLTGTYTVEVLSTPHWP